MENGLLIICKKKEKQEWRSSCKLTVNILSTSVQREIGISCIERLKSQYHYTSILGRFAICLFGILKYFFEIATSGHQIQKSTHWAKYFLTKQWFQKFATYDILFSSDECLSKWHCDRLNIEYMLRGDLIMANNREKKQFPLKDKKSCIIYLYTTLQLFE